MLLHAKPIRNCTKRNRISTNLIRLSPDSKLKIKLTWLYFHKWLLLAITSRTIKMPFPLLSTMAKDNNLTTHGLFPENWMPMFFLDMLKNVKNKVKMYSTILQPCATERDNLFSTPVRPISTMLINSGLRRDQVSKPYKLKICKVRPSTAV